MSRSRERLRHVGRLPAWRERVLAFVNDGFVKATGLLVGGTALAHGLTALAMPVSTRLFTPQDFAAAAAFSSLAAILTAAACLRFDMAIPLPADEGEAACLLALSVFFCILASAATGLLLVFAPPALLQSLGQPSLLPHLWLLPIAVLIGGLYLALQMWSVRRRNFGAIARSRVIQSASAAAGQLGLGALGAAPLGLLVGQALNYGAGSAMLGVQVLKSEWRLLSTVSLGGMIAAFRRHHRFPRYSVAEALANAASIQLPILLIAALANGPEAGYLTLAIFLLQAPMALVGNAVGQVYLSEAPERLRSGDLTAYTMATVGRLANLSGAPLVFLAIVSPVVFEAVFGEGWSRAGLLVTWMAPWFFLQFIASPTSSVLHVLGRQSWAMGLQLAGLLVRMGAVILAAAIAPDWISEAYAVSGLLFYGIYLLVVLTAIGATSGELLNVIRPCLPRAALGGLGAAATLTLWAWLA